MHTHTFSDQVSFSMDIAWSDHFNSHQDLFFISQMNCWRDLLPDSFLCRALKNKDPENSSFSAEPGAGCHVLSARLPNSPYRRSGPAGSH